MSICNVSIPLLDSLFNPNRLWSQNISSMLLNTTSAKFTLVIIPSLCPLTPSFLVASGHCTLFSSCLLIPFSPSPFQVPSTYQPLDVGLHQGSALFLSHTHALGDLVQPQGVRYHVYVGNSQISISGSDIDFLPYQTPELSLQFVCPLTTSTWMTKRHSKLNKPSKLLLFPPNPASHTAFPISGDSNFLSVAQVKI